MPKGMITKITSYKVTHYSDNGQTLAECAWQDNKGCTGTTIGSPDNAHMLALLHRAQREGVTIERESA